VQAFFLPAAQGQRLCIHHAPNLTAGAAPRGTVLYVHPFAEEMNKSRRMAAQQSRALAQAGFAVLQIDLLGCGDSSADLADATWQDWLDDVALGQAWLSQRYSAPRWLWALRAGALLACQAAKLMPGPSNFLFWQASSSGKTVLQQFLRLRMAGDLAHGGTGTSVDSLRQELSAGKTLDVAGYRLPGALAAGLQEAQLVAPASCGRLVWLEVASREAATLLPATQPVLKAWQAAGFEVHSQVVQGPGFWQTTEIEDAPALLSATTAALLAEPSA
jgi:uncharacterized protein